jgi:hypothetical protein
MIRTHHGSRAFGSCLALAGVLGVGYASADSASSAGGSAERPVSPTVRAMTDELKRAALLSLSGAQKPYFVANLVHEADSTQLYAAHGALVKREHNRFRVAVAQVRLGDYRFDNSNFIGGEPLFKFAPIAAEEDYDAIRRSLWLLFDQTYKQAVEGFAAKQAAKKTWAQSPDDVADFSHEPPLRLVVAEPPVLETEPYVDLLRNVSRVFREYPFLQTSRVTAMLVKSRRYFVSTEGAMFVEPRTTVEVALTCSAQADDGMLVHNYSVVTSVDGIAPPEQSVLVAEAHRIAKELDQIRTAPLVDDFDGPVLFEGEAAGQILSRLVGGELSGTPPPKPRTSTGSEFARRLGQRVMPKGIQLVDDPGLRTYQGIPLLGAYRVDNEGVPGQKVVLVQDGILKDLLMTRTPRKGSEKSNGHARMMVTGIGGASAGNLVLTASGPIVARDMRARLLAEVRKAKAPYGLVVRLLPEGIDDVSTAADPTVPSMHRAAPLMKRVMPDGREQVVRGAKLERLDTRVLDRVVAVGQKASVHNCSGLSALRESLSVVSPPLLFAHVVVSKPEGPQPKLPLITRPKMQ